MVSSNISGLNIVSVDGSSVIKKYMNVDFSFLKAIAVKYHFYRNHLANIEYYPDLCGYNNYRVQGNYLHEDDGLIDAKTSMEMRRMEINLLNEMIAKKSEIDLIVIDGTILVMPISLVFSKDPEISLKYDALLKEFHKLYMNCAKQGILLIGSIKDSRTSALTNLLRETIQLLKPSYKNLEDFTRIKYHNVMKYFSDIDLFNKLLHQSERSCIFNCKREIDKLREDGIKKEISYYFPLDFYAFYLKSARYDTPSRIEFFIDENSSYLEASKKADLISSILLPIASLNDNYGLPIPQIEAHKRAVFKPSEINLFFNNLNRQLSKNGVKLMEKRRNRRPF
ncbi:MAG: DNA double-strand break repair nuclease NurA [Promethearchaeota archaeon]